METLGHLRLVTTSELGTHPLEPVQRAAADRTADPLRPVSGGASPEVHPPVRGMEKGPPYRDDPCDLLFSGALGRIRTCNLLIRSQVLYPLSYERAPPGATWPAYRLLSWPFWLDPWTPAWRVPGRG